MIYRYARIEFWRLTRTILRYPLELIGGVMGAVVVFSLFFSGVHYLAGPGILGDRLEALVIGLLSWSLAFSLLSNTASTLSEEALAGLLEQLVLTKPGLLGVVLIRAVLSLVHIGLLNIPIFLAVLLSSQVQLHIQLITLPLLAALAAGSLGIGLAFGGLALIYKRIGQLLGLLQFALLGLFLIHFETLSKPLDILGYILPLAPAVTALRETAGRGIALETPLFLWVIANATAYMIIGVLLFSRSLRLARKKGLLSIH